MIRQCYQYNLQRLTINLVMCFFMSCLNYFIGFFFSFLFTLSKGGWYFFSLRVWRPPLITPVTQVRFTYKSLQILLEETKQGGGDNDLLFGYDDPGLLPQSTLQPILSLVGFFGRQAGIYVRLSVGPITLVKSYNQSHKFWCIDFCLSTHPD